MSKDSRGSQPDAWSLAFTLVGLVVVFVAIGYGLDRWLKTLPWLMIAGVFVGAGFGFVYLVVILFSGGSSGRSRKKRAAGEDQRNEPRL